MRGAVPVRQDSAKQGVEMEATRIMALKFKVKSKEEIGFPSPPPVGLPKWDVRFAKWDRGMWLTLTLTPMPVNSTHVGSGNRVRRESVAEWRAQS